VLLQELDQSVAHFMPKHELCRAEAERSSSGLKISCSCTIQRELFLLEQKKTT